MYDRFDLENAIVDLSNISKDLKLLGERLLDEGMDEDEFSNVLIGLESLTNLRYDKAMDVFESMLSNDLIKEYNDDSDFEPQPSEIYK